MTVLMQQALMLCRSMQQTTPGRALVTAAAAAAGKDLRLGSQQQLSLSLL
jgi:hypothetical protein